MESHIKEGKKELNFSTFGSYSNRRKKSKLKAIVNQINDDEMPLSSYTFFHKDAKLSEIDKKKLIEEINQLKNNLTK